MVPTNRAEFERYCLNNKYSKWYFRIIDSAIVRGWNRKNTDVYLESHHYVPKSFGGTETVYLTAKEHFICHLLLFKMFIGDDKRKMSWALNNMRRNNKYQKRYINSSVYKILKENLKHTAETIEKVSSKLRGKPKSESHRKNLSIVMKKRILTEETLQKISESVRKANLGKPKSEEHKLKISKSKLGKSVCAGNNNPMFGKKGDLSPHFGKKQTEEHKEKRLSKVRGRKQSLESKIKMSQNRKKGPSGKKWFNNGTIETFDLPENKPKDFEFGRLKRAK